MPAHETPKRYSKDLEQFPVGLRDEVVPAAYAAQLALPPAVEQAFEAQLLQGYEGLHRPGRLAGR